MKSKYILWMLMFLFVLGCADKSITGPIDELMDELKEGKLKSGGGNNKG